MAGSWTENEPGYFTLRGEVARLTARAGRRKWVVLTLSLGVAAVSVLMVLRAPRNYEAQLSIRVTEVVEFKMPRSNWTDRELRSYITDVAFTQTVLKAVYDKYLREENKRGSVALGIDRLRDGLDVIVSRNRIVAQMEEGKPTPKSAYVVLRFSADTAEQARGVLAMLAKPIIDVSAKRRRREAELSAQQAAIAVDEAKKGLQALYRQAMKEASKPMRGTEISPVRLLEMQDTIADAQRFVSRLEVEKVEAERRQRAEKTRPGINFSVAGDELEEPLPLGPLIGVVAIVVFLLSLPIWVLLVGAFDPFVQSLDDIRRLGIPALGRLRNADET